MRSWSARETRARSLLFLTLVNQSSTISLTQRFNIPATLSFGVGGLCFATEQLVVDEIGEPFTLEWFLDDFIRFQSKRLTNTPVRQAGVCVEVSG